MDSPQPPEPKAPVMVIIWVDGIQTSAPEDSIYIPFFAREKKEEKHE